jgi:hypothetical protein
MKLVDTLPTNIRLFEERQRSNRQLLNSVCEGMTKEQRRIVEGVYESAQPLLKQIVLTEAQLTQDQINQIFGQVEQGANASGTNRTALGKSKDVVAAANKMIDDAGKWLQDTAPVKAFDNQFDKLKLNLKDKLSQSRGGLKTLKLVQELGDYAKENPKKTAFVIGVLTAIAAVAGGPVGGAIAGQVLRGSLELVKGEKLSTAIGKGLKTAAVGALAGATIDAIGDAFGDAAIEAAEDIWPGGQLFSHSFENINIGNGLPSTWQTINVYGTPEQVEQVASAWNQAINAWDNQNYSSAMDQFETAKQLAAQVLDSADAAVNDLNRQEVIQSIENAMKVFDGLAAAAQGAASGATSFDDKGNPVQENIQFSEHHAWQLFTSVAYLTERQRLDELSLSSIKQQAGKIAGLGMKKAQEIGKNMTTRVTASKLMAAWKKAGEPTDSEQIAALLDREGIDPGITTQSFSTVGVELPGQTATINTKVNRIKELLAKAQQKQESVLSEALTDEERAELEKLMGEVGSAEDVTDELKQEIETLKQQTQTVLQQPSAEPADAQATADEPVDTPNDTFDGAIQKYLQSKGLARGGLTYTVLNDILKTNGYSKPEQWVKNAGIAVTNPGTVVSKADMEKMAALLAQGDGKLSGKAAAQPQTAAQGPDLNALAQTIKSNATLQKQIQDYLATVNQAPAGEGAAA